MMRSVGFAFLSDIGGCFRQGMLTQCLLLLLLCVLPQRALAAQEVELVVEGVEGAALHNVQMALTLPRGLIQDGTVDIRWLERFESSIPRLVKNALKPYGFYHAESTVVLENLEQGKGYRLKVGIEPGSALILEEVTLGVKGEGASEEGLKELIGTFPLKKGGILRQDLYEEAKAALKARALDLGYLDADFPEHSIAIDPQQNQARIGLTLSTGPHYYFSKALIHGAPEYPERFLARYLAFKPGDPFSYARLGQTQANFLNSERFRQVLVSPRMELAEEAQLPVGIELVPAPRRRLRPGLGYGTDTGARASLRYRDLNLFRLAHELKGDFMVAERRQLLGGSYNIPFYKIADSYLALRSGFDRENPASYDRRTLTAEGEVVRGLGDGYQLAMYLRLLQEDYRVAGDNESSRLVLPGIRFSLDQLKGRANDRKGVRFDLEVRGASQTLGSQTSLIQFLGTSRASWPLAKRWTLLGRLQGGTTQKTDPLQDVPVSLRFFAGGDQSVRGYAYQALGPKDGEGRVEGGIHQMVGSLEIERSFGHHWGTALFYDAGNAFNKLSEFEIASGAGVGVRYYTPVGPIRVDLARTLGEPDASVRLHFSMGFGW